MRSMWQNQLAIIRLCPLKISPKLGLVWIASYSPTGRNLSLLADSLGIRSSGEVAV